MYLEGSILTTRSAGTIFSGPFRKDDDFYFIFYDNIIVKFYRDANGKNIKPPNFPGIIFIHSEFSYDFFEKKIITFRKCLIFTK